MGKKKDKDDIAKLPSKAERQAAFLKACEGLTAKEINKKASMFTGVNVSDFKIIKMIG
jgi:hypothetical protein